MCLHPIKINGVEVPCQECWQCKEHRIEDWVGRCIAESKTSFASSVVTLTYGDSPRMSAQDNDWHATSLVYNDVQLWLKRLRRRDIPLRYFAVGEYGSRKGRAHWHIICFWQQKLPPGLEFGKKFMHDHFWPHGWTWADHANVSSIRYVMKYIVKSMKGDDVQTTYGLSKMPPLGAHYFRYLARLHVDHQLSPQDLRYSFTDVRKKDGTPREFWLRRHSAYHYLAAFDEEWQLRYHNEAWPNSDLMDLYVDLRDRKARRAAQQPDIDDDDFMDFYFRDELAGIKKHFGGEKSWTLPTNVAALAVERLIAESQNQYLIRKKVG